MTKRQRQVIEFLEFCFDYDWFYEREEWIDRKYLNYKINQFREQIQYDIIDNKIDVELVDNIGITVLNNLVKQGYLEKGKHYIYGFTVYRRTEKAYYKQ